MNIAILGGGLMGSAIAERLIPTQPAVTVYNRTLEKISSLTSLGISITNDAQQAIELADVILLTLSDGQTTQALLSDFAPHYFTDKLFIQMGTIAPDESIRIAASCQQLGADYLECPVLGSQPEARQGTLLLMAAGDEAVYQRALPILNQLGNHPEYIGQIGDAAVLKLALNQLIAGLTSSFALSLALVESQGISTDTFMTILRDSALYAPTFDKKLGRMQSRDFANPNFPTKHLLKDTRLFLEIAEQYRLDSSSLTGIENLLRKTIDLDLGDGDYSALYGAISPDKK